MAERRGPEPITLHEAADRLAVHYMTAYRYVRTGRLRAEKHGGEWRVDPRAVAELAAAEATGRSPDRGRRARSGARPGGRAHDQLFLARLVADDEAGAWRVVEDALAWGHAPAAVLDEIVRPAMAAIGERWEAGDLHPGDEHVASAIALRILGRLGPQFARPGRRRGTIIIGAPPNDRHGLPIALVADPLRGQGFEVVDLGPDTPAPSFGLMAAAHRDALIAVGIGATTARNHQSIRAAISAVRGTVPDVPVVLGGAAVPSAAHAHRLGADHWTSSVADLLERLEELAPRSRPPKRSGE
jgi:excisionase family DNA binding protein